MSTNNFLEKLENLVGRYGFSVLDGIASIGCIKGIASTPSTGYGFSLPDGISSIGHINPLIRFLLSTYLFPKNYEFEKDYLIHLWIAWGLFFNQRQASDYFDELLAMNFFGESNFHPNLYYVKDDAYDFVQHCGAHDYARLEYDDKANDISEHARHLSIGERVDLVNFETISKLRGLKSLLLFHENKKFITHIPYDLFLNLKSLRVLDLSKTGIYDLPSSIGDLEALRFLDLSETCIKWLPQSITNLKRLYTLNLRDCYDFSELPEDISYLINLTHLDLDIVSQLTFMPPRIGDLIFLETLRGFIVGKDDRCKIAELGNLWDLHGSLSISKLEHVLTSEDAEEARLYDKKFLRKLVMQWSRPCFAEEILEALMPCINLEELDIVCYGGLIFPTWVGDPSFSRLSSIFLHNCENCVLLLPLGQLPCLKHLRVEEMDQVRGVDNRFCGVEGCTSKGFPSLETLIFDSMPCLEKWTRIGEDEMPCLQELTIVNCPELIELPKLAHLKSLRHLEISLCFKLPLLNEEGLLTSLQRLVINDCPILEERCCKEGVDWEKIKSISSIWINYQQISKE